MFSDKIFRIAFVTSLLVHGALLLSNPNLSAFPKQVPVQTEVRYLKNSTESKERTRIRTIKDEPFLKTTGKITVDKRTPPPYVDRDMIFSKTRQASSRQGLYTRPILPKSETLAVKRRVTLPLIEAETINNPTYISYYQLVREKIRRAAYQNYTRSDTGEVYLSFIISDDGELREVRLNEDRSSSSAYLQRIALRSMQDAAPFPSFPKELDYPQLSFNVIISFQVE